MVTDSAKPIIWIIDENKYELRTHSNILKRLMPTTIEVKEIEAYKHLNDYLPLIGNPQTACIITDQKLKVRGTTDYTGIELAEFLRGINPKLPIYILTNFAEDKDEFAGGEWSVEEIIKKDDLRDEEAKKTLKARILRHINVYDDIRNERAERLHNLLMKDIEGNIEDTDLEELQELKLQELAPALASELERVQQMEQVLKAHEEFLERFKHLNQKGDKDVL